MTHCTKKNTKKIDATEQTSSPQFLYANKPLHEPSTSLKNTEIRKENSSFQGKITFENVFARSSTSENELSSA
jgi:hypothetical protein